MTQTQHSELSTDNSELRARPRIPPPSPNSFTCVYLSSALLSPQPPHVRHDMILAELLKRLDLSLGIEQPAPEASLADLGVIGTSAGRFARTLATFFHWVTPEQALTAILGATTIDDLASALNHKV